MLFSRARLAIVLLAVLAASPVYGARLHHAHTGGHVSRAWHAVRGVHSRHTKLASKLHGQQSIDPERVTQIQQALISAHYLTGEANGQWDESTRAAMQKYQADQGWQTKLMPDSRALKKLGLGPDYSNAINAQELTSSAPPPENTISTGQSAGFAAAAGVDR